MSGKCVSDPHDFTAQFIVVRKSLDDSKTILCLECLVIFYLKFIIKVKKCLPKMRHDDPNR